MFTYFKDVLLRLQGIQDQLTVQNDLLREQNEHLSKLSGCVQSNHYGYGDRHSLSTKHWNSP